MPPREKGKARIRTELAAAQAVSLPASVDASELSRRQRPERGTSLRSQLANLPLFEALEPASLHELILRARVVALEAGQVLFRQGEPSSSLYVVVDGAVTPIAEGDARRKLAVLERGDFVGEIGLVTQQPRNATVAALVDSKLIAIDRGVLFPLMRQEPKLALGILRPVRQRMLDRQVRTNLFFAAFSRSERSAVARQFRLLELKDGVRAVAQGEPPAGLFVVLAGSFRKIDRTSGRELGRFEIGDAFGGPSLLDGTPSTCDIVAQGKAWLIVLGETVSGASSTRIRGSCAWSSAYRACRAPAHLRAPPPSGLLLLGCLVLLGRLGLLSGVRKIGLGNPDLDRGSTRELGRGEDPVQDARVPDLEFVARPVRQGLQGLVLERSGNPKEVLLAPQTIFRPSSSRINRMVRSVTCTASGSAAMVRASGSIRTSSGAMP